MKKRVNCIDGLEESIQAYKNYLIGASLGIKTLETKIVGKKVVFKDLDELMEYTYDWMYRAELLYESRLLSFKDRKRFAECYRYWYGEYP